MLLEKRFITKLLVQIKFFKRLTANKKSPLATKLIRLPSWSYKNGIKQFLLIDKHRYFIDLSYLHLSLIACKRKWKW